MSEVQSGLEGIVAFATEIAEPDKEGGALRYRGVDIEDLVGQVPFEQVWGCWWTGSSSRGCHPPSRIRWASAAEIRGWTCSRRSPSWPPSGASSR